jgi:hypothetical protein
LGLLLAVFGLEALFGGTESTLVLSSMGGLVPERVLDGEIWRLFSCTFLHSGFLHLAFNGYVLWVLGSFLERLLGTWRFLLLYGLSCLGASLTSMYFLDGIAVGASGGLWGLLGADAVLAWRSQGLLPKSMIEGARNAAKFNLIINVLNSSPSLCRRGWSPGRTPKIPPRSRSGISPSTWERRSSPSSRGIPPTRKRTWPASWSSSRLRLPMVGCWPARKK